MSKLETLAKMNVDHYNNHRTQHNVMTVALGVAGAVVASRLIKRIVKENDDLRSGQYA